MEQIIYTSQATSALASGEIFAIVETSAKNNAKNDLTGFLLYSDGRFLQILEGPKAAIDTLMRTLAGDPRHEAIKVVHRAPIETRTFPKWAMKRVAVAPDMATLSRANPAFETAPTNVTKTVQDFLKTKPEPQTAS